MSNLTKQYKRIACNLVPQSRKIPCVFIESDFITIHMLALTDTIENGDTILNKEQVKNLLNSRLDIETSIYSNSNSYKNYSNLIMDFKDFPTKRKILNSTIDYLRVISTETISLNDYKGPMRKITYGHYEVDRYLDGVRLFENTGKRRPDFLVDDSETKMDGKYKGIPTIIIKTLKWQENHHIKNFLNCKILIVHSDGGYWCNLNTTSIEPQTMIESGTIDTFFSDTALLNYLRSQ